jgi:hypothetical protein
LALASGAGAHETATQRACSESVRCHSPFGRNFGKQSRRIEGMIVVTTAHLFNQFEPELLVHGIDGVKAFRRKTFKNPPTLRDGVILRPPCGPSRIEQTLIGIGNLSERVD